MKFKTKEELIKYYCKDGGKHIDSHMMISEIFKSFKERIEFYKKYRDGPDNILRDEHPEVYKLYNEYREELKRRIMYNSVKAIDLHYFNNWLFDYCFGDVIE